ncbi:NAD(P)-binding protein [Lichtheimia hyalospora FSU 10163]|nr:NAD(P)-binding protein [Lichtheimia hyalospora FSU 10163]
MSHLAVYGGAGALGRALVTYFKERGFSVTNIDLVENAAAQHNMLVNAKAPFPQQASEIESSITNVLQGQKLKALFCVAGGWAGGNASSPDFINSADLMWKQSVQSSLVSAQLASRHLDSNGLLVLTGALPAAEGATPGMIGYGVAKAAVHHLVKDLAAKGGGLPDASKVIGLCPVTLDTPGNRQGMPGADFSSWTPLETVAKQLHAYTTGSIQVTNGSLVEIKTKAGETTFNEIQ